MGLKLKHHDGQTPLDEDEIHGLKIKSISTQAELDELEQLNIEQAIAWSLQVDLSQEQVLTEKFIKDLHKKMFGNVWKWAGTFRKTDKNIVISWTKIGLELKYLLDDAQYWIANESYSPEETAIRFKHRIVAIHCFPNGNGRHARIMADIIMASIFKKPVFYWHQSALIQANELRKMYIRALKEADNGNIEPLLTFALT